MLKKGTDNAVTGAQLKVNSYCLCQRSTVVLFQEIQKFFKTLVNSVDNNDYSVLIYHNMALYHIISFILFDNLGLSFPKKLV